MNINVTKPTGVICKTQGKYCAEDITVVPVLEEKSATPTESAQEIVPSAGNCGISKLNLGAVQTETKTITPTTSQQTFTPTSGKYFKQVICQAIQAYQGTATPTKSEQTINPTSGKYFSSFKVGAIPSDYIKPTGTLQITDNGAKDVTNYKEVNVNVESGASLNIAYGDTPPTNTTKLWIKAAQPANIKIDPEIAGPEVMKNGVASLPTGTYIMGCAAVGTKIYLFGGYSKTSVLNTIQCYDTTTNTISTLSAKLPNAARDIAAAAVGTKIYLFGGYSKTSVLNTIQCYDTTTNTISTLSAKLPKSARAIAAAAVGTKIYLFGGSVDNGGNLSTINVFDTTTNAITTLSATLPATAYGIASAAIGTKIYLFGGVDSSGYLSTINVFDTTTNAITTLSTILPKAAYGIASAAIGTKIYLFGGKADDITLSTINQFVVSVDLTSGNILVVTNTVDLFSLISTDTVSLEVGIANIYKGNTDNQAELCDAYLYDGTNWVNVNTGKIYST